MKTLVSGPTALTLGATSASVAEFLSRVLREVVPLRVLQLALLDAVGSVAAEPVRAQSDIPGYDAARVDGYAVISADVRDASPQTPVRLPVIGDIVVGSWQAVRLPAGAAFAISKGAPIPAGCDAVVPQASTDGGLATVQISRSVRREQGIARASSIAAAGDLIAARGAELNPPLLGVLASAGFDHVLARPKPRVICAAVGTEYVEVSAPVGIGHTIDAASFVVTAGARQAGAQAFRVAALGDDPERVRACIADNAMRADLLVVTGDVRMLVELFSTVEMVRLAMIPEGDVVFGRLGSEETPVLGIPGEAGAAHIWFELLVRPIIRRLINHHQVFRHSMKAALQEPVTSAEGSREFRPAKVTERRGGGYTVKALEPGAQLATSLASANALLVLSDQVGTVPAGASVDVMMLDRDNP